MQAKFWKEGISAAIAPLRQLTNEEEFKHRLSIYQKDPILWANERFGIPLEHLRWSLLPEYASHVWDGTKDPLAAAAEAIANWQSVGIESGTGTGKTFFYGWITYWFLDCFELSQVGIIGPTFNTLRDSVWKEVTRQFDKFKAIRPHAVILNDSLQVDTSKNEYKGWGALLKAPVIKAGEEKNSAISGLHAKYMLLIHEETQGLAASVTEASKQTCSGPYNVRLAGGNPDNSQDALHKFCKLPNVLHIRISSLDHPNVVLDNADFIPGAISAVKISERLMEFGGDEAHPIYRKHVRGICPEEARNSLIKLAWLYAARDRGKDQDKVSELLTSGPKALGVDVADSPRGDKAAIARGQGGVCFEVEAFHPENANKLGELVAIEMARDGIAPEHVGVDTVGVGVGCYNELKRLGYECQSLRGGAVDVAGQVLSFGNLRAQMYWQLATDLREGNIILPADETLFAELIVTTYEPKNSKIYITEKEQLKAVLRRSPDKADACVYWNWVRRGIVAGKQVNVYVIDCS